MLPTTVVTSSATFVLNRFIAVPRGSRSATFTGLSASREAIRGCLMCWYIAMARPSVDWRDAFPGRGGNSARVIARPGRIARAEAKCRPTGGQPPVKMGGRRSQDEPAPEPGGAACDGLVRGRRGHAGGDAAPPGRVRPRGHRRPRAADRGRGRCRQRGGDAHLHRGAGGAGGARGDGAGAGGPEPGPLHGLPVAHKDLHDTAGVRTTYGSVLFADHVPDRDALVVQRMSQAGAISLGKTNTPEFGAGSHTVNTVFGATRNPYDLSRSAGGSSGGAAAALAARMISLADGSDLGGSLRNPASFCNVVGLRPSPGRVPTWPVTDVADVLGVEGPMGRTVADVALLLSVLSGPDRSEERRVGKES